MCYFTAGNRDVSQTAQHLHNKRSFQSVTFQCEKPHGQLSDRPYSKGGHEEIALTMAEPLLLRYHQCRRRQSPNFHSLSQILPASMGL